MERTEVSEAVRGWEESLTEWVGLIALGSVLGKEGLNLRGEGSWNVKGCGKPKNRGKGGTVSKKGWATGSVG